MVFASTWGGGGGFLFHAKKQRNKENKVIPVWTEAECCGTPILRHRFPNLVGLKSVGPQADCVSYGTHRF